MIMDGYAIGKRFAMRLRGDINNIPSDISYEQFAKDNIIIKDRYATPIPFIFNKAQLHFSENMTGRDIIVKSRQLGFSTFLQGYALYKNCTTSDAIATITDHADNTAKFRLMAQDMFDDMPDGHGIKRTKSNASMTVFKPTNSQYHCYTAGNKRAGRSSTLQGIHASEVAFWDDAKTVLGGLLETIPYGHGWVALESTTNGQHGHFYELVQTVIQSPDDSEWTIHFYGWWWEETYKIPLDEGETLVYTDDEQSLVDKHHLTPEQIKWRRAKIRDKGDLFPQEYPESLDSAFIGSNDSYFGDTFDLYTVAEPIPYNDEHTYVAGCDLGQQNDYTVVFILDTTTLEVVNILRVNKMSYTDIADEVIEFVKSYNATLLIENNTRGAHLDIINKGLGANVAQFNTNTTTKPMIVRGLKYALESNQLKLLDYAPFKSELNSFVTWQTDSGHWKYEGKGSSHDDCVIALALAWYEATRQGVKI